MHVFGWQPIALTGFSQATIDAGTALRTLSVDDKVGTALYDEVVLAAESLRAQPQRGRVLVLLTDGREPDLGSLARLPSAIRAARRAGMLVYPIAVGSANVVPLRQLAAATGGRLYSSPSTASLGDVFRRIANELQRTWAVSYATTARPGDAVVVRAQGEGPPAERSLYAPRRRCVCRGTRAPVGRRRRPPGRARARGSRGRPRRRRHPPRAQEAAIDRYQADARAQLARRRRADAAQGARPGPRGPLQRDRARFGEVRHWQTLGTLLQRAAVPLRPAELFYLCAGTGLAIGLVAAFLGLPPVAMVIAFAVGFHAPIAFVWMRGRRRLRAFETSCRTCSRRSRRRSGPGTRSSTAFRRSPRKLRSLRAASSAVRSPRRGSGGRSRTRSRRCRSGSGRSTSSTWSPRSPSRHRSAGRSLDLFDLVAETVRNRQQHARKVRSLTAMGRMSAYVLVGLPFALALILNVLNPGLMSPLFNDPIGRMLIAYSLVSMAIGGLVIKRIVAVKA